MKVVIFILKTTCVLNFKKKKGKSVGLSCRGSVKVTCNVSGRHANLKHSCGSISFTNVQKRHGTMQTLILKPFFNCGQH